MIWERIRELQIQEEQTAAQEAENKRQRGIEAAARSREQAELAEQLRLRNIEARRRIHEELLENSGVLPEMREIEKGLEGRVRKHAILVDLDKGIATLVWGNKFTVSQNEITYEKGMLELARGLMDYSCVSVKVNLSAQTISMNIWDGGRYNDINVSRTEWEGNRLHVRDLLAQAYLHPQRINQREEPPSSYSSSSSNITECCNS